MKPSNASLFQSTSIAQLVRPWNKERDGTLFYGLAKSGTKRHALTTKQGNKNFYKGTRSSGVGRHTRKAGYVIQWNKVRTFVTPKVFNDELKCFVSPSSPQIKNEFKGYVGPMDPKLYIQKLREYIWYGKTETEESSLRNGYIERG
jgi:large subunit ribosomal protein L41